LEDLENVCIYFLSSKLNTASIPGQLVWEILDLDSSTNRSHSSRKTVLAAVLYMAWDSHWRIPTDLS